MEDTTNSYRIKDISFFGSPRRILLQSANGPCPLLAICNVMLLKSQISLPRDVRYVSFQELIQIVSNTMFDANSAVAGAEGSESASARAANVRESLESALEILPHLNVGLDINCNFGGCQEFEYTRELAVFDLLDIGLFHGWVVSSQDKEAFQIFGHLTYNQVVELLIAFEEAQMATAVAAAAASEASVPAASMGEEGSQQAQQGGGSDGASAAAGGGASGSGACGSSEAEAAKNAKAITDGLIVKEFMDRTAAQLSYEGLLALHEKVKERELAVFFRNSHFSTLLRYNGDLYLLCTDIGYGRSQIVWERLDDVDGDTALCDAQFVAQQGSGDDGDLAALEASEAIRAEAAANAAAQDPQSESANAAAAAALQSEDDARMAWEMMQEEIMQEEQARGGGGAQQAAHVPGLIVGQPAPGQNAAAALAAADARNAGRAQAKAKASPAGAQGTVVGTVVGGTGQAGGPAAGPGRKKKACIVQ